MELLCSHALYFVWAAIDCCNGDEAMATAWATVMRGRDCEIIAHYRACASVRVRVHYASCATLGSASASASALNPLPLLPLM